MTRIRSLAAIIALGFCSGSCSAVAAAEVWLSEADIRREMTGHAMKGYYRDGEHWVDDYSASGAIAYRDQRGDFTGKWSFQGNVFCTFYSGDINGGCYLLRQLSRNCFEYVIVPNDWRGPGLAPQSTPQWYARGWRGGDPSTCEAPPMS